ncbi:MAG: hypothetical protein R3B90_01315 [Planctomycetaceae bacterium]
MEGVVATIALRREMLRPWIPAGFHFADGRSRGEHPLQLFVGRQAGVSAYTLRGLLRMPWWGLEYHEIILAIPDLVTTGRPGIDELGVVTYLPKIYLTSWVSTLLGRGLYGFSKNLMAIERNALGYLATASRGDPALQVTVNRSPAANGSGLAGGRAVPDFFAQPIALIGARRSYAVRLELSGGHSSAEPVSLKLEAFPPLLKGLTPLAVNYPNAGAADDCGWMIQSDWTIVRCDADANGPASSGPLHPTAGARRSLGSGGAGGSQFKRAG